MPAIQAMTAMTCSALSHRYSMSGPPHPGDELRHVVDRRLRQDAVAEVEDVRPALNTGQDMVDALRQRIAAGDQRQRVEVPLRGYGGRKPGEHLGRVEGPVEGEGIAD